MQIKNITNATLATLTTELTALGFTVDSGDASKFYWSADTNQKMYYYITESGTTTTIALKNSAGTAFGSTAFNNNANPYKLIYEVNGDNSILFGLALATFQYNQIYFAIVAPATQDDDWQYHYPGYAYARFYNGRTESYNEYQRARLYNSAASGIQIVKMYDGTRFTDNVFLCPVNDATLAGGNASARGYEEVTVGNDTYIVFNINNQTSVGYTAIKKVVAS